jgi:hypothetical protein
MVEGGKCSANRPRTQLPNDALHTRTMIGARLATRADPPYWYVTTSCGRLAAVAFSPE